jgi:hypothetical protein
MSSVGVSNIRSSSDLSVSFDRDLAVVVHPGNHPRGDLSPTTPPLLTRWNFILDESVLKPNSYEEACSALYTPEVWKIMRNMK